MSLQIMSRNNYSRTAHEELRFIRYRFLSANITPFIILPANIIFKNVINVTQNALDAVTFLNGNLRNTSYFVQILLFMGNDAVYFERITKY